jgi:hypothetical protein
MEELKAEKAEARVTTQSAASSKRNPRETAKNRPNLRRTSIATEQENKKRPRVTPEKVSVEEESSCQSMNSVDDGEGLVPVVTDESNEDERVVDEWSVGSVDGFRVLSRSVGQGVVIPKPSALDGENREALNTDALSLGASEESKAYGAVQEREESVLLVHAPETVSFPSTGEFYASLDWCALMLSAAASCVGWALWVQVS